MECADLLHFRKNCTFNSIPSDMNSVPRLTHYVCKVFINIIPLFMCSYFKEFLF
jgi:hypothetical protein